MLPALQPSRPKAPQQSTHPTYAHQQRRTTHEASHPPTTQATSRPRSQIEAMPPSRSVAQPSSLFCPMPMLYDSAVRHPVFFTQTLRKPPFPIPQFPSHGWSPVANGYIHEQKKVGIADSRTKL